MRRGILCVCVCVIRDGNGHVVAGKKKEEEEEEEEEEGFWQMGGEGRREGERGVPEVAVAISLSLSLSERPDVIEKVGRRTDMVNSAMVQDSANSSGLLRSPSCV